MPHTENVIDVLKERGLIETLSSPDIYEAANKPMSVYVGFDPSADSLHLGHLLPLLILRWFQKFGLRPIAIAGGATGFIGDPSFKSIERPFLDEATITQNLVGIQRNIEHILDMNDTKTAPLILNNLDWFKDFSFIGFLREVGKYFRMGPMLAKESVKLRLDSEEGMSFTEFSYPLLQGYDFFYLNKHHAVSMQIGGNDQWGNITAGIELVRKIAQKSVFGMTNPLLTRSDGKKFGKSEQGAVWLSAERLPPYDFYQYLFNVSDADVIKMMKLLTFMDLEEIEQYAQLMQASDYKPNTAQKRLAEEVTCLVHGQEKLEAALRLTLHTAPGAKMQLNETTLQQMARDSKPFLLSKESILNKKLIDVLVETSILPTKGEARRMIRNGGIYLNEEVVSAEDLVVAQEHLLPLDYLLIGVGKKKKVLLQLQK